MRHQVRNKKFRSGIDANRALMRKLSRNFFEHGKITTTVTKVKVLRPYVEKVVHLAKKNTEASKNMLLRVSGDKKFISVLTSEIAPVFQSKQGGYVRVVKIGRRTADGTEMGRLEWTLPVVLKKNVKKEEPKKNENVMAEASVKDKEKKEVAKPAKIVSAKKK